MEDYKDYEKEVEKMNKRNEVFLKEFKKWLTKKGLKEKTINNHASNADLYINDYLNYYDVTKMEDGTHMIDAFLGDWFIRKCLWSTAYSIKTTAASIKKFYQCMCELEFVPKEDYEFLCETIKSEMENWIEEAEDYNLFDDYF